MNRFLVYILLALSPLLGAGACQKKCPLCPAGQIASVGGCSCQPPESTGGKVAAGGQSATGGAAEPRATGGNSSEVIFPGCLDATAKKAAPLFRPNPKLLGWRHPDHDTAGFRIQRDQSAIDRLSNAGPIFWPPTNPINLNQGSLGSCAATGANQALACWPFKMPASQAVAIDWYRRATLIDGVPSQYPPDDTGTTLDAVWRIILQDGVVRSTRTCQTLEELRAGLQTGPGEVGTDWPESFFEYSSCGEVSLGPVIAGGHGYAVVGDDPPRHLLWFRNSWLNWGTNRRIIGEPLQTGYFSMSWDTFERLTASGWECVFPEVPP